MEEYTRGSDVTEGTKGVTQPTLKNIISIA